jgi:hypothetical protein
MQSIFNEKYGKITYMCIQCNIPTVHNSCQRQKYDSLQFGNCNVLPFVKANEVSKVARISIIKCVYSMLECTLYFLLK